MYVSVAHFCEVSASCLFCIVSAILHVGFNRFFIIFCVRNEVQKFFIVLQINNIIIYWTLEIFYTYILVWAITFWRISLEHYGDISDPYCKPQTESVFYVQSVSRNVHLKSNECWNFISIFISFLKKRICYQKYIKLIYLRRSEKKHFFLAIFTPWAESETL